MKRSRRALSAALDACIDVSGVCSLCDSYVRLPVLQPLYERCKLKMRRVLPAGLFVAPLVFSSTGVFLESTLRPLLVRFAVVLREEHPADDDDILQEMSERASCRSCLRLCSAAGCTAMGGCSATFPGLRTATVWPGTRPLGEKRYGPPTCAGPHGQSNERWPSWHLSLATSLGWLRLVAYESV